MELISIKKNLEIDKNLYAKNPNFGMDIYSENFEVNSCIILENNGKGRQGIPIKCGYYELNLSILGKSTREINHFKYNISAHSLQLIMPKDIHSFLYEHDSLEYIILFDDFFYDENIEELILFHKNNQHLVTLNLFSYNKVLELYKQINLEFKNKEVNYIEVIKSLLTQILYFLKREKLNKNQITIHTKAQKITKHFFELVEEYYSKKKNLQDYSILLNITSKYLSKIIKENNNSSALFFIHNRIIKEIQYLLCYSNKSLKEISTILNFNDTSSLGRFFKKYENTTLNTYRLKNQKNITK